MCTQLARRVGALAHVVTIIQTRIKQQRPPTGRDGNTARARVAITWLPRQGHTLCIDMYAFCASPLQCSQHDISHTNAGPREFELRETTTGLCVRVRRDREAMRVALTSNHEPHEGSRTFGATMCACVRACVRVVCDVSVCLRSCERACKHARVCVRTLAKMIRTSNAT